MLKLRLACCQAAEVRRKSKCWYVFLSQVVWLAEVRTMFEARYGLFGAVPDDVLACLPHAGYADVATVLRESRVVE